MRLSWSWKRRKMLGRRRGKLKLEQEAGHAGCGVFTKTPRGSGHSITYYLFGIIIWFIYWYAISLFKKKVLYVKKGHHLSPFGFVSVPAHVPHNVYMGFLSFFQIPPTSQNAWQESDWKKCPSVWMCVFERVHMLP